MSQQTIRIQKQTADIQRILRLVEVTGRTGLCAVCHHFPIYTIRPSVSSMTCGRMQCRRAWLLNEPWRCPECKSMDFERVEMTWDSEGRKLYRCGQQNKTFAIQHRTFETVTETETEAV
jgi:predicted nucleic-acid-binding Zn-ribbon protein